MSGQTKVKTLASSIFKARSTPVPSSIWPTLMVRSEGAEVNELLQDWGAPDLGAEAAITLLISARERTGRLTGSKLVIRGPIYHATADNPIKANTIWPGVDEDYTVRFGINGDVLNFANGEARNVSLWAGLDTLQSFRVYKGDDLVARDDLKDIEGLKDGASYRVAVYTYSTTHMTAALLIVPKALNMIRAKAQAWNVSPESNLFPAVDITGHWTRYDANHPAVSRLPGLQTNLNLLSLQTAGSADQPYLTPQSADCLVSRPSPTCSVSRLQGQQTNLSTTSHSHGLSGQQTTHNILSQPTNHSFIAGTAPPGGSSTSPGRTLVRATGSPSSRSWRFWAQHRPRTSTSPHPSPWSRSSARR